MSELKTDGRSIRATRAPEAEGRLVESRPRLLDLELQIARDLAEVDGQAAFVFHGCASVAEYATRLGYDYLRALDLCSLGKALRVVPALEQEVREGKVSFAAACELGKVLSRPSLPEGERQEWHDRAKTTPLKTLRRAIKKRLEEERQESTALIAKTFYVTEETDERFGKVRTLASQREKKELSESQAFDHVVGYFLDHEDMTRQADGVRRVPDTALTPYGRGIPAAVERAIRRRSGDRCEVPGCRRTAAEFGHVKARRTGSPREVRCLLHLCHRHHVIYDLGFLRFLRWSEDGKPVMEDRSGRILRSAEETCESASSATARSAKRSRGSGEKPRRRVRVAKAARPEEGRARTAKAPETHAPRDETRRSDATGPPIEPG